jgi:hypothetical protein
MQCIGSGLDDHVNIGPGASSEFRRVGCAHDLEFGYGVRAGMHADPRNQKVLVLHALERDLICTVLAPLTTTPPP